MKDKNEVLELFYDSCFNLSPEDINSFNDAVIDVGLNNVICGMCNECFGLRLTSEYPLSYELYYVTGKEGLIGSLLRFKEECQVRDELVFIFSKYLEEKYLSVDLVDVYNTFQWKVRTLFEKLGYFTVSSEEIKKFDGYEYSISAPGAKGVIALNFINKLEFWQTFFKYSSIQLLNGDAFIYLMLNVRNGLVKIGTSKKPRFREKTLHSDEPEINLIAVWNAPKFKEKELHKLFWKKRVRGEWFALKSMDLRKVKESMSDYSIF